MQLSLFDGEQRDSVEIPPFIQELMTANAALAVSVSGGKDSDAMLRHTKRLQEHHGWTGEFFALFCDLGRIEWPGVSEHLHSLCTNLNVSLVKVSPNRPMIEEWQRRYETLQSKQDHKPFWSSSAARYCTKHEKTQPADKLLRQYSFVICAVGLRAEESTARAQKPRYQVRNDITATWYKTPASCRTALEKEAWAETAYQQWQSSGRQGRFAITWHPIHDWSLERVWQENGTSSADLTFRTSRYRASDYDSAFNDFPCHWAYAAGNTRLSCALCVLASAGDIENGAKHNPLTWAELSLMELISGWSFQQSRWLVALSIDTDASALEERDRLFAKLHDLGFVSKWEPRFQLVLLIHCPVPILLLWTKHALSAIAQLIQMQFSEHPMHP